MDSRTKSYDPLDEVKTFDKTQHPLMIKALERVGNISQHNKTVYNKAIATIKLNGGKTQSFC